MSRLAAVLLVTIATVTACTFDRNASSTSSTPAPTAPTAPSASTAADGAPCTATGVSAEIVVQVGDRELRSKPETYLSGPTFVVYADASFYAVVPAGDGQRFFRGQLDRCELDALIAQARPLSDSVPATMSPADDYPVYVAVAERRWVIGYESPDSLVELLAQITDVVEAAPRERWTPSRWIVHTGDACSVVEQPSPTAWDAQPIYPHELGQRPLGPTTCEPG